MDAGRSLATDIEKILFGMTVGSCQNLSLNPPTQYICQENIFAKGWRPKEKTSELKAKSWQKLRAKNFGFGRKLCKSYQTYAICRDIKICCNLRNFRKTLGKRSTFGLIFSRQMRHYARNRKFANLIQYNMQIYHVVVHFLPKKHCFWPKKSTFFAKKYPKSAYIETNRNIATKSPSPNFSAEALRTFAQLLPPCYMVYIAFYTESNLQICICRENSNKYAHD